MRNTVIFYSHCIRAQTRGYDIGLVQLSKRGLKYFDPAMIEKILVNFDFLYALVKSSTQRYRSFIGKATSDELRALWYCSQICSKCLFIRKKYIRK